MVKSESTRAEDLADLFVSVTGDEAITERQDPQGDDRELRDENRVDEAVADGLQDAVAGAEADAGDPGSVGA
ncbi:MAG: hypothetical protein ABEH61_02660 [Haloarculaceae archaeon]